MRKLFQAISRILAPRRAELAQVHLQITDTVQDANRRLDAVLERLRAHEAAHTKGG